VYFTLTQFAALVPGGDGVWPGLQPTKYLANLITNQYKNHCLIYQN
jgi:hypothetical protein